MSILYRLFPPGLDPSKSLEREADLRRFAEKRGIDMSHDGWMETVVIWAAREHPELNPPKRGAPRKSAWDEALEARDFLAYYEEQKRELEETQGNKVSDRDVAKRMAVLEAHRAGRKDALSSNQASEAAVRKMANKISAARRIMKNSGLIL
ncbi:hypothetical protein [Mesorhizobium sp. KR2-14]|uniref:hypothetical protein n=1 Tax=Mesorhizobium sp. KR2-14 TaxID=3156610 RepID=UPI0032B3E48E